MKVITLTIAGKVPATTRSTRSPLKGSFWHNGEHGQCGGADRSQLQINLERLGVCMVQTTSAMVFAAGLALASVDGSA